MTAPDPAILRAVQSESTARLVIVAQRVAAILASARKAKEQK